MGTARTGRIAAALAATAAAVLLAGPAEGHEIRSAGAVRLTIGWADEPAVAGIPNAVEVVVTDDAGAAIGDAGGLRVAVAAADERVVLALDPTDQPGRVSAPLVPTRAGTYTFHVVGSVAGQVVDVTSTCSEQTFDCVTDGAALHFPARDPSNGELAARLERESRAVARAERAADEARRAAVGALALGALTLLVSLTLGRRARTRVEPP